MKLVRVMIVALALMLVGASASFAAASFATSAGLNQVAVNAQTGLMGSIQLTALSPGIVQAGEILSIIVNGTPISSLSDLQATITIGAGVTTSAAAPTGFAYNTAYNINTGAAIAGPPTVSTPNNSTILIRFPAAVTFGIGDNIMISGVRINANSLGTVGANVTATVSSVLGGETVTNPTVPVAILVEPISIAVTTVANFTTAATTITTPAVVKATELFPNGFETKSTAGVPVNPTQLIFNISGIPTGLTLGAATINTVAGSAKIAAAVISTVQTTSTAVIVVGITDQDSSSLESISINLPFSITAGVTSLPVGGLGTIQGTLGPAATATQLSNVNLSIAPIVVNNTVAGFPLLFAQRLVPTPPATVVMITQLTTQLLSVFNSWIPGTFDTGFAIANTTGYNFSLTQPLGFLASQPGNVVAVLYPADGTAAKTVTTSATVFAGTGGLDASGQIPPHGMWTFLLSQLATQAGFTTGFTGQVYFLVNASNAHGINYISDSLFKVQAQGYPLLVLPTSRALAGLPASGLGEFLSN
jgi:hypothetical protein